MSNGDLYYPEKRGEPAHAHDSVDPAHQRAVRHQRFDALGLVSREFHPADPEQHDHQPVAGYVHSDQLQSVTHDLTLPRRALHCPGRPSRILPGRTWFPPQSATGLRPARIAEADGNRPADRQPGRYHSRAGDPGVVGVGSRPPGELFVVRPSHRRKMIAVARRTSPACHRLGTNNQVGSGVRRALGSDIGSSPNAKAQRTGSPRFKLSFPQLRGCGAFQLPQYPWVPQSVGNSSAVGHHRPGSVPPDAEGEPARAANSPTSRRPWASAAPSRRPPPSAPAKVPAAGRAGRAVSLRRGRGFPDCHYITVFSRSGGSGDRAARQDLARVGPTHRSIERDWARRSM